ncbi:10831_t:CDS:2, partial [Diversispora eburnea]
ESRDIVINRLNYSGTITTRASLFNEDDLNALNVRFQPAPKDQVIPNEKVDEFPHHYVCPKVNRDMLDKAEFDVDKISDFSDSLVRTFFFKLHNVTRNQGIPESRTDTLVDDLLRITHLNNWPLNINIHPPSELNILNEPYVSATPEFVVNKGTTSMVIVEDKHFQNVDLVNKFGELQIAGEILTCGSENMRGVGRIRGVGKITDQVLFSTRFISSYVTFYKAKIPAGYWSELAKGLPIINSVEIKRWPEENDKESGLDLSNPDERK